MRSGDGAGLGSAGRGLKAGHVEERERFRLSSGDCMGVDGDDMVVDGHDAFIERPGGKRTAAFHRRGWQPCAAQLSEQLSYSHSFFLSKG